MIVNKAYKYRIYPNVTQTKLLNQTFGCCRFVWNNFVSTFNNYVEGEVQLSIKELREEYDFLNGVSAGALQQVERNFNETKKQYFNKKRKKKLGRPQFKSKKKTRCSYKLPNKKFYIKNKKIWIEKVGKVQIILDRMIPSEAKILSATVSKDSCNDYFVSICVEENVTPKYNKTEKIVGVDLGLKDFCILSDETVVKNPHFFLENQKKLKRSQQHLSRKQKGSKRRQKQKIKVAKIHRMISRQREWFLHQISSMLVREFDVIAIEDLNIAGMKKLFGKSVSDVGWNKFIEQLKYKALWNDKEIIQIGRFKPSTKLCSECQSIKEGLTLADRSWTCDSCNTRHDRDTNAARSILAQAVGVTTAQQTWRDSKTVDVTANFDEALIETRVSAFTNLYSFL
jgi:putative transposase